MSVLPAPATFSALSVFVWIHPGRKKCLKVNLRSCFPSTFKTCMPSLVFNAIISFVESPKQFVGVVKEHYSGQAAHQRKLFDRTARIIIGTHLIATLCATAVLAGHGLSSHAPGHIVLWPLAILLIELLALGIGFGTHQWFHRATPSRDWALSRLMAEINRSVAALGNLHMPLDYLFRLHLPDGLMTLLRTLNILHLHSTRPQRHQSWQVSLKDYLNHRLRDAEPSRGQIAYYRDRCRRAQAKLRVSRWVFAICSVSAIVATGAKFLILAGMIHVVPDLQAPLTSVLGALAVFLPVLAVGALSWAATQDYEAQAHGFSGILAFLERRSTELDGILADAGQQPATGIGSARDAVRLIEEIEQELLGEVAEWYTRRTFGSVA